ncbi:gem-associated protein 6 [Denticeps clupeoides]|uniref:Gem-associated protein 6 n=1 Tax=Denticeps clupeoides TaxID=299321 RepID=A0AAY4AKC9_9TELE|nr:gem-associated protein 6 [Denticeps clupeoides]
MREWREKEALEWSRYAFNLVRVTVCGDVQYEGWVFTVDPVSASVVLVNFPKKGQTCVQVVMGHAVETVEILKEADENITMQLTNMFSPAATETLSNEELEHRGQDLCKWLEKNRIPVMKEGQTLRVASVLTINAPYRIEDCSSSNEIILARVQSLLQSYTKMN